MDLKRFKYKQTLEQNPTQKTLIVLGQIQQSIGQAILIITPKIPKVIELSSTKQTNLFSSLKQIFQNDIYSKYQSSFQHQFQIQTIYPITQKHKNKYKKKIKLIQLQSGQNYQQNKQIILQKQLKHIGWVKNIINGQAEQQRVIYQNNDIVILPDFKYHNLKQHQNLHLLCIFKNMYLHSIRDLNQTHLQLLQSIQIHLNKMLKQVFNPLGIQNCRIYFHYPPTFYQLHIHIQNLSLSTQTSTVERCHLLRTVINNIKIKSDYYQKIDLYKFKQVQIQSVKQQNKNII